MCVVVLLFYCVLFVLIYFCFIDIHDVVFIHGVGFFAIGDVYILLIPYGWNATGVDWL